jgi:type I restriction-modification system DNA methylase subunit
MSKTKNYTCKLSKLTSEEQLKLYETIDIVDVNKCNKKLINNNYDNKKYEEYNKEIMDNKKQKVELSNNISNKEALKDKIHEIHNYLRNNGAGYGMNALKVFNLLYGLKKIEEKKLLDKVNLKQPECEFSYLLKIANENKDDELSALIRGNVLDSINSSQIKNLLFYEIPKSMTGKTFSYLIKEIDKITIIEKTCNVLLSGKIYEYFIGRDETAISELGAYFTDRHIVDYIYKKLDPEINEDGTINSMIDMFGGSGGFTTGYINFLNNKYKDIDWKNNIDKVYHFDMNEDVIKSAGLEFFCLTGVLPNMKDNVKYKNSFIDEFNNKKFMNIITNPPYGGDKVVQTDTQIKGKKIKEYIKKELLTLKDELKIQIRQKQLKKIEEQEKQYKKDSDKTKVSINTCSQRIIKYAKHNKLTGNDKESSSLILIMDLVEENGTAIGVLKEGVFFNKTYKDIRKCLIENFNVREIISIPQDQFENTTTKTSIIIFNNTKEKTTKVKFYNLIVERYTEDKFEEINDEIVLTENKDDICGISDILVSEATKDEILKNPICSLNGKDYNKKEIICGKDYEFKKLDEICDIKIGTRITKKNSAEGIIPVYGGGDITFYTNTNNRNENTLIVSRYALSKECVRIIPNKFYLNDSGLSIHTKDEKLQNYINYYLLSNANQKYIYENCTTGSIQKNINITTLKNMLIAIPKSKQKIIEWVNKISKSYHEKNKDKELIMNLEEKIKNKIKYIRDNEDCDEVELDSICEYIKIGKNKTPDDKKGTLYPYYGTSDITGYTDHYLFDGKHILVARNGTMGNCFLVEGKIYPSDHIFVIKNKEQYNISFIFYLMKELSSEIQNKSNGSTIKGISKENLSTIKIKLPKNKKLIKNLDSLFQEMEKLQSEIKEVDIQYKKLIKELTEEAMPYNKQQDNKLVDKINNEENELSEKKQNSKNKIKTKSD